VSERVLGKIFGPKEDEEIGDWKKVHSQELHNLHNQLNRIISVTKSKMKG
jgi:hypothetical protein